MCFSSFSQVQNPGPGHCHQRGWLPLYPPRIYIAKGKAGKEAAASWCLARATLGPSVLSKTRTEVHLTGMSHLTKPSCTTPPKVMIKSVREAFVLYMPEKQATPPAMDSLLSSEKKNNRLFFQICKELTNLTFHRIRGRGWWCGGGRAVARESSRSACWPCQQKRVVVVVQQGGQFSFSVPGRVAPCRGGGGVVDSRTCTLRNLEYDENEHVKKKDNLLHYLPELTQLTLFQVVKQRRPASNIIFSLLQRKSKLMM